LNNFDLLARLLVSFLRNAGITKPAANTGTTTFANALETPSVIRDNDMASPPWLRCSLGGPGHALPGLREYSIRPSKETLIQVNDLPSPLPDRRPFPL
jgi:hypothetical protein